MTFIWVAIFLLVIFGILNLVTGISNDAVNFLNSAMGSGAARRKTIFIVSGAGLLTGTYISSGMMEVVRNGIIYPGSFYLNELISVFLAAMIINILLIDTFNNLKIPVSTTLAVLLELAGGAFAIAVIKNAGIPGDEFRITEFINIGRIFFILSGIVLTVVMSFFLGMAVQFVTRLIFTFDYRKRYKILFSIFGGGAITAIMFMIFKKSVSGMIIDENYWGHIIGAYLPEMLVAIFAGTTFVFFFLSLSFDFDISRLVVLFGTFALALSYAANDLVNFIGLPLAGIESIKTFLSSGGVNPQDFSLDFLNNELVQKETFRDITQFLIFTVSALIMIVTLFVSRKVLGVTETEIFLGRQSAGYERFEASPMAGHIVRSVLKVRDTLVRYLPAGVTGFIKSRYSPAGNITDRRNNEILYFDTIRAVVNLTVAGLLISLGTYLRFPLSTTFVVFMVAMGTSLADHAWREENAVYRVSGVIYVMGAWILAAFLAFAGAFLLTPVLFYGKWAALMIVVMLMFYRLYRSNQYYFKKVEKEVKEIPEVSGKNPSEWLKESVDRDIQTMLIENSKIYFLSVKDLIDGDQGGLEKTNEDAALLSGKLVRFKGDALENLAELSDEDMDAGNTLVLVLDHLSEMTKNVCNVTALMYEYINNSGSSFSRPQRNKMTQLSEEMSSYFNFLMYIQKEKQFDSIPELIRLQGSVLAMVENIRKSQLKRVKKKEGSTLSSLLILEVLADTRNILLYSVNFINTFRKFVLLRDKTR